MRSKRSIAVIASILPGLAAPVVAAELVCSGQIVQLNYHSPDAFMIRLSSMNNEVFFCRPNATFSVSGTSYTTSAESCRAMVALFMAGKLAEKSIATMYFDGDQVPSSCSSWPAWGSANIRFFRWQD
jgi:hypothetical protein